MKTEGKRKYIYIKGGGIQQDKLERSSTGPSAFLQINYLELLGLPRHSRSLRGCMKSTEILEDLTFSLKLLQIEPNLSSFCTGTPYRYKST